MRILTFLPALALFSCGKPAHIQSHSAAFITNPPLRLQAEVTPQQYSLEFSLDPKKDSFSGKAHIDISLSPNTSQFWLHGKGLTIQSATWKTGKKSLSLPAPENHMDGILVSLPKDAGTKGTLSLHYTGKIEPTDSEGIFRNESEGVPYLYTQFEPIAARKAFPHFDEPRFKTTYQVTITAPSALKVFTNTPLDKKETHKQHTTHIFRRTKPIPSYLLAFAVGDFDILDGGTAGKNNTPLRFITPKGQKQRARYAKKVTGQILEALENYTGIPYPYKKLDSIAVPYFFGAMEHPGLITYTSRRLLSEKASPAPDKKRGYVHIAAHELAHQWFGNLVTHKWWNDIWLNESFATWLETKVLALWEPKQKFELDALTEKRQALHADILQTARKIRQPIKTQNDIHSAFDSITYAKGASILQMFEAFLGEKDFQRLIQTYLQENAWKNTSAEDFYKAIEKQSNPTVRRAFESFVEKPGAPLVKANIECNPKTAPVVRLSQTRLSLSSNDSTVWSIPVCFSFGKNFKNISCTILDEKTKAIPLKTKTCPKTVHINPDHSGYYAYLPQKMSSSQRLDTLGQGINAIALFRTGNISVAEVLPYLKKMFSSNEPILVKTGFRGLRSVARIIPDDKRKQWEETLNSYVTDRAAKLGWLNKKSDTENKKYLRSIIVPFAASAGNNISLQKKAHSLTRQLVSDELPAGEDLYVKILTAGAKQGLEKDYSFLKRALRNEKDNKKRGHILRAIASFRERAIAEKNWVNFQSWNLSPQENKLFVTALLSQITNQDFHFEKLREYLKKNPQPNGVFRATTWMKQTGSVCTKKRKNVFVQYWESRKDGISGGTRAYAQSLESIDSCISLRAKNKESLQTVLKPH